jgi:hypothetical protein
MPLRIWSKVQRGCRVGDKHSVANCKASVDDIKLIPLKVEIRLHARDIGGCQVGSIQIVHEIPIPHQSSPLNEMETCTHQTAKRQNEEIDLPNQLLLSGSTLAAPEILSESGATHIDDV